MDTTRIELNECMESIELVKGEILAVLNSAEVFDWDLYRLPEIKKEEEGEHPTLISVVQDNSEQALQEIKNAIFSFYGDDKLSTKEAQRKPGFIHIMMTESEYVELKAKVTLINTLKSQFKTFALQIKDYNLRFEILHSMFSYLITLNVYRQIHLFKEPKAISFFWVNKENNRKCDVKTLLKRLDNSKQRKHLDIEHWSEMVEREIIDIKKISDPKRLRFIRPIKTQPVFQVKYDDTYPASIPAIIVTIKNENTNAINTEITPLKNYDINSQKQSGRKRQKRKLIVERLNLYEVGNNNGT